MNGLLEDVNISMYAATHLLLTEVATVTNQLNVN